MGKTQRQIVALDSDYLAADAAIRAGGLVVTTWVLGGKAHLAEPKKAMIRTLCGCKPFYPHVLTDNTTADMCQRCMVASRMYTTPMDREAAQ